MLALRAIGWFLRDASRPFRGIGSAAELVVTLAYAAGGGVLASLAEEWLYRWWAIVGFAMGESFDMPDLKGLTMLRGLGRGRLGVHIQDLNADMADALGVTGGKGVLVTDVVDDTPASKVGFKAGDVITEVGGSRVDDVNDLQRELGEREGRVSITLMRRGARRTVEPELGDKREVLRWESDGDGDRKVIRIGPDRKVVRIPDVRKRVERDVRDGDTNRDDLEQQMRELREELRELRRKMEANEKP